MSAGLAVCTVPVRFILGNAEECRDDIERHARMLGVNGVYYQGRGLAV
jgi:hypothetical protein